MEVILSFRVEVECIEQAEIWGREVAADETLHSEAPFVFIGCSEPPVGPTLFEKANPPG